VLQSANCWNLFLLEVLAWHSRKSSPQRLQSVEGRPQGAINSDSFGQTYVLTEGLIDLCVVVVRTMDSSKWWYYDSR
jgi:hypothetical protein